MYDRIPTRNMIQHTHKKPPHSFRNEEVILFYAVNLFWNSELAECSLCSSQSSNRNTERRAGNVCETQLVAELN